MIPGYALIASATIRLVGNLWALCQCQAMVVDATIVVVAA
jgi:hypothetical protein